MGCINSKRLVAGDSPLHSASTTGHGSGIVNPPSRNHSRTLVSEHKGDGKSEDRSRDGKKSKKDCSKGSGNFSFKMSFSHRSVEAEQNAAGWPPWLTANAGEAIHGWVPLRADSYVKLDKVRNPVLAFVISGLKFSFSNVF